MVMFTSGDIFKAKAAELLDEIQEVKKNQWNIISYQVWITKQTGQIRSILAIIRFTELKVNTKKCSLGSKDINHLGYVITWYGINFLKVKYKG